MHYEPKSTDGRALGDGEHCDVEPKTQNLLTKASSTLCSVAPLGGKSHQIALS